MTISPETEAHATGPDRQALLTVLTTEHFALQLFFTLATMIGVLNAVVAGCAVGFVTSVFGAPLGPAAAIGATAAILSILIHLRWQGGAHDEAREGRDVLRPSVTNP